MLIIVGLSHLPQKQILQNYLAFPFLFCAFIFILLLAIKICIALIKRIRTIRQHPVSGTLTLLILAGIILFTGVFIYRGQKYKGLPNTLFLTQETLAEVAVAKKAGDALAAGKKDVPGYLLWENVQRVAGDMANQLSNLTNKNLLSAYGKSGIAWANKIRDAAKDPSKWKDVPDEPDTFTITLRQSEATELYKNSMAKITELIQFGDYALSKKDHEAMRYIAARLLVQRHWLESLKNYQAPNSIFGQLVSPAYATGPNSRLCAFSVGVCSEDETQKQMDDIIDKLKVVYVNAFTYSVNTLSKDQKDMESKWLEATRQILATMQQQKVLSEDTVKQVTEIMQTNGLLPGQPPKLQTFKTDCVGKGGTFGEGGQSMKGMPTQEQGFYCNFKKQDNFCWDYLSYSGNGFSGGSSDCAKLGLLPGDYSSPKQEVAQPTETKPAQSKTAANSSAQKTQLKDLGPATGTGAPKIQFTLPQSKFTAKVNEPFSYSFCQPESALASDLCTAASTNPRYGLPPYTFYLDTGGFLPFGLTLNLNGLLEGTPTAEGSRTVGICAKDTGGFSVCRKITINVTKEGAAPPTPQPQNQGGTWDGNFRGKITLQNNQDINCLPQVPDSFYVKVENNRVVYESGVLMSLATDIDSGKAKASNNGYLDASGSVTLSRSWTESFGNGTYTDTLRFSSSSLKGTEVEDRFEEDRWTEGKMIRYRCVYDITATWSKQ